MLGPQISRRSLYAARSSVLRGVDTNWSNTSTQIASTNAYAGAFSIIHNNLDAAMRGGEHHRRDRTLNAQAKSAARSPSRAPAALLRPSAHLDEDAFADRSIERDLDAGHAAVIQIVSTGEGADGAGLAEIPTRTGGDVQVDITPRGNVLDYLAHSFPVQLHERSPIPRATSVPGPSFVTASRSRAAKPSAP